MNYVHPDSRTTYAKKIKNSNFDAGTTAILNMASLTIRRKIAALTIRRKKPTRDDVRECDGRAYVRGSLEIAICIPDAENDVNATQRTPKYCILDPKAYEDVCLSDLTQMPSYLVLRIQNKDTTRVI